MRQRLTAAILIIVTGLFAAAMLMSRGTGSPGQDAPPGIGAIQQRPGAYFPEGFPLHGEVRLLSSPVVEAGRREHIRIEYTVGDMPVEAGMSIEIWKHFTSDVEELQTADPGAPAYLSVEISRAGAIGRSGTFTNWAQRNNPSVFPYRKAAVVTLEQGQLEKGDKVLFDLGGAQGVRMQRYEETLFNLRVVLLRGGKVLGYGGDAIMRVTGGPLHKLRIQAPSVVALGEQFPVEIVPQDEWGSLAKDSGGLSFRVVSGPVGGGSFRYEPQLLHYVARDVMAASLGIARIGVETADGSLRGVSNPIWVEREPVHNVYYGDLHQHSYLADGRGVFEELYLYARRVGLLDYGAVTPHHAFITTIGPTYYLENYQWRVDHWPELMRATKRLNGWQGLVTILGYEYSVSTALGGHHNVFFRADEAPTTMHLDPTSVPTGRGGQLASVAQMLKTLQLVRKPTLVIPHIGGGPPDWSHPTDPRVERLFEIASVHGVFEESWFKHLESGLRLAASASGDTHTTSMGNSYPGLIYTMTNPLTGVYATGKSRDAIWDGLYQQRSFAVTGNSRMLLDFRVNGEQMGGELAPGLADRARMEARVSATAPVVRVQLLKNLKVVYSANPARSHGALLRVVWGDNYYQRRACVGMAAGELRAKAGKLRLHSLVNLDQGFEEVRQNGDAVAWNTAAVSGDRDGFLVDISGVKEGPLTFRLDDSSMMGVLEVTLSLDELKNTGHFSWRKKAPPEVRHSYMEKMGVEPAFFLDCELVDPDKPLDFRVTYVDEEPPKSGDFYLLRVEQLDTNKGWSSPVWVN